MVFAHLKQHTQTHHTQLENTVDILNRMKTKHQYQHVLELFFGFYKPLEASLASIKEIEIVDFQERRKTDLLRDDLRVLGLSDLEIDTLPLCTDLPHVTTLAEACGCLYVLEGATLGGQIITRQIQKLDSPLLPHTFFTSYGTQVGKQWKALQEDVERMFGQEQVYSILTISAQETFMKLEHWFQTQSV